ncbi:MAG: hypothetical protein M3O34_16525 [Chloroflexota bacterium]|nr:hypothetical protein [Chloroflexota bacterium]
MALRLGSLRLPWRRSGNDDDPYWEAFINRPPADVRNMIPKIIGQAPEGNVFPTRAELHTPAVTSRHVKELASYLDSQLVGIVDLGKQDPEVARGYPFAVVCAVRAEYDPYTAPGVGGQAAVQAGQFVTFIVAAWIREMGYRATMKIEVPREQRERLAVAAGLGRLNGDGRLTVPKHGTRIHVADIIFTDLPLAADG